MDNGVASDEARAGLASPQAPTGLGHAETIANADGVHSGSVHIGKAPQRLRDGSTDFVLRWEAVRRPLRVCEGGGWYSAHPTETAWVYGSWMGHKGAPGWEWPKVSESYKDIPLEEWVNRDVERALVRHGFARPQGIEAGTATTEGRGPKDESPSGKAGAPNNPLISTPTHKGEEG